MDKSIEMDKTMEPEDADGQEGHGLEDLELTLPTEQQVRELREKAAKSDEYRDRMLREAADFENYRKRAARERQDAVTFANESLFQKLIPVLDNFEMALAATSNDADGANSVRAGIVMISSQLKAALASAGLEEIDAAGKVFDPNLHEAVSEEETANAPEGHVVRQIRKGYKLKNRLIRPAGVVVAKKPASK